jgi:hypothetical protein
VPEKDRRAGGADEPRRRGDAPAITLPPVTILSVHLPDA